MDVGAGLRSVDVEQRRARYGPNVLPERRPRSPALIVAAQFKDVMVLMLVVAALVAAIAGDTVDIAAIAVIVALNAVLGASQEWRAERALASLRSIVSPVAKVRRDAVVRTIPAIELVPGDVVLVDAGELIPADLQLVEVVDLEVSEATLTGESVPVAKSRTPSGPPAKPGDGDRSMAFQGTLVTRGRGVGVVVDTGSRTRVGRIATLLRDESGVQTPLQQRLTRLGRWLAVAAIALCAMILVVGVARGVPLGLMLMTAVSLAVAAVPEALPTVVTVGLAAGARKLARQQALIRRLGAVETLGSVTVICSDKTGTLTENRMRVDAVSDGRTIASASAEGAAALSPDLLHALAISNDVAIGPSGELAGDPTEVALCELAAHAGHAKRDLEMRLPRVAELAFSTERARMTTVHRANDGDAYVAFTKGAPERVIPICRTVSRNGVEESLDQKEAILEAEEMAWLGLRVLALAVRRVPELPSDLTTLECGQTLLGLVGLLDPPRAAAAEAVRLCQRAGIRVVMITGDHAATALAIASRLGIATESKAVITGPTLRALSPDGLDDRIDDVRVYARVAAEDKLRIVKALQARGEFVAMTGDGVNDAPALRRANIGIAMGRGGTDVARDASAMVLLDNDFATIVAAVREGRRIYDNIRKFIQYVLTGNVGEISAVVLASLIGFPVPLLPIQILWVNLVSDGLPGLALTAEPAEANVMRRPPRPPVESVLANGLWQHVLWVGTLIGVVTTGVQAWALARGIAHWQSLTFTVLTFAQMAYVFSVRSAHESIFSLGIWTNRPLLAAVALTVVMQLAVLYVPVLQGFFHTAALSVLELGIVFLASLVVLAAVETQKFLRRRSR
jgi:Ca2+-transporting ATPase